MDFGRLKGACDGPSRKLSKVAEPARFITLFSVGAFIAAAYYHDVHMMGFSAAAVVIGLVVWFA